MGNLRLQKSIHFTKFSIMTVVYTHNHAGFPSCMKARFDAVGHAQPTFEGVAEAIGAQRTNRQAPQVPTAPAPVAHIAGHLEGHPGPGAVIGAS